MTTNEPADTHRPTDAQMAAIWAAQALTEGRYALGRALANLALEAERAQRDAHPAPLTMSDPRSYGDLAKTELFGQPNGIDFTPPASGRCIVEVMNGAYREACGEPAYWAHGNIGDDEHPAVVAGWYHIDPELDQRHQAMVNFTPGQ